MGRSTKSRGCQELIKLIIFGMNGVAVARYELILSEDGATGSRKVFRYLLGLRDAIYNSINGGKSQEIQKYSILRYFYDYYY